MRRLFLLSFLAFSAFLGSSVLLASGVVQAPAGYKVVAFSATPTFTCNAAGASSFYVTLTGNVTSSTVTQCSTGQIITWEFCQDGAGTHTVAAPTNVLNFVPVDTTAHHCSTQTFVFDGTNAQALGQQIVTMDDGSALDGAVTLRGSTSGAATWSVAAAAGTAHTLLLPTTVGAPGQALFSDGASPATLYWDSVQPAAPPVSGTGSYLVSGGSVAWAGGLDFVVQAATYVINGVQYSAPQTFMTMTADGGADRIDVVIVDTSGTATFLAGTPGVTPSAPVPDPSTQLGLTFVYIPAGSGTPSGIASTLVYDEDAGPASEWTTTVSGAGMAAASTNNPYHLTKDIEATAATTGQYAKFVAAAPLSLATKNALVFYIRSKASWGSNRSLQFVFKSGSTQVGSIVNFANGSYGFSSSNTSGYQQIVIPLSLFNTFASTVDTLQVTVSGTGGSIGFYLDYLQLQSGITGLPNQYLTWKGAWSSAVGYSQNDVTFYNGAAWVALAANTNSAPTGSNANWGAMAGPRTCLSASFDGGGAALTAGKTVYATLPTGGTIQSWNILAAAATGTNTIKVWRVATGTALPVVGNSINTSGVSLTSGTAVHSTTLTDFTSTAFAAHDIVGVNLLAVDGAATYLNFSLECQ